MFSSNLRWLEQYDKSKATKKSKSSVIFILIRLQEQIVLIYEFFDNFNFKKSFFFKLEVIFFVEITKKWKTTLPEVIVKVKKRVGSW